MPELPQVALNRTVPALLGITHGDGGLGSWQGSGAVSDLLVEAVIKASGVRSRPLRQARDWGYQRLSAGQTVLLVDARSEEHTSELQSLMRISYAVFCLKKKH